MNQNSEEMERFAHMYGFLGYKDQHLIRIFHWLKILGDLINEVRESDQDHELEKELLLLTERLAKEMAMRLWNIIEPKLG